MQNEFSSMSLYPLVSLFLSELVDVEDFLAEDFREAVVHPEDRHKASDHLSEVRQIQMLNAQHQQGNKEL